MGAVKVDGRELVFSTTFLVKDDQVTNLAIPVKDKTLRIDIRCVAKAEGEATLSWNATGAGVLQMDFVGWKSPLGTVTGAPARLGDVGGEVISFQAAHYRISDQNLVHFFIFLGVANG